MQELLLVNPRRRRKGGRKAKSRKRHSRRRTAAQRAATRKLVALNRAKRTGRKSRRARSRISTVHVRSNPMSRRRRSRSSSRRYRRNPSALSIRAFASRPVGFLMPAIQGAAGAVLVNTVLSRLPLPPMLITGRTRYVTQAVAAVALGALAQRFLGVRGALAARMAEGSLTVTMTDVIRDFSAQAGFPLGRLGFYMPARAAQMPNAGGAPAPSVAGPMGAYVTGPGASRGSVTPINRMAGLGFGPGRTF